MIRQAYKILESICDYYGANGWISDLTLGAYCTALKSLKTIGEIKDIIRQTSVDEDVLKYKMICELMKEWCEE